MLGGYETVACLIKNSQQSHPQGKSWWWSVIVFAVGWSITSGLVIQPRHSPMGRRIKLYGVIFPPIYLRFRFANSKQCTDTWPGSSVETMWIFQGEVAKQFTSLLAAGSPWNIRYATLWSWYFRNDDEHGFKILSLVLVLCFNQHHCWVLLTEQPAWLWFNRLVTDLIFCPVPRVVVGRSAFDTNYVVLFHPLKLYLQSWPLCEAKLRTIKMPLWPRLNTIKVKSTKTTNWLSNLKIFCRYH